MAGRGGARTRRPARVLLYNTDPGAVSPPRSTAAHASIHENRFFDPRLALARPHRATDRRAGGGGAPGHRRFRGRDHLAGAGAQARRELHARGPAAGADGQRRGGRRLHPDARPQPERPFGLLRRVQFLRHREPGHQRLRRTGWIHLLPYRPHPGEPERGRTRLRGRARDCARHAATRCAHDRSCLENEHPDDRRHHRRHPGRGSGSASGRRRADGDPGGGGAVPDQFHACQRKGSRRDGYPPDERCRFRHLEAWRCSSSACNARQSLQRSGLHSRVPAHHPSP